MKLLIIGDAISPYIINFTTSLKELDNSISVDIVNVYPIENEKLITGVQGIFRNIFNHQPLLGAIEKAPKLKTYIRSFYSQKALIKVKKNMPEYDAIVLHGFFRQNCLILKKIYSPKIFSLGAIWGSDFYNRGKNETLVFETVDLCNRVNLATVDLQKDFLKIKPIAKENICTCLFGLAPLGVLCKTQHLKKVDAKKILGLQENDFTITCGYNGTADQQHIEIINSIAQIKDHLPANYKLIFPLTYGKQDRSYQKQIKKLLQKNKLRHVIYEDFMTDESVAHLRKATDIFIQIQKTDAFSGSMQEHLFAQSIVITGEWLPYQSLKEKDIYFETINSMSSLSGKIAEVINNYEKICETIKLKNTPEKFTSSLWSECIRDWYNVLAEYKVHNKQL